MSDVAEIVVHGRHVEVSKRFREHVHNKLDRIDKFGIPLRRVDVEVSKEANPRLADRAFEVELTTRANGAVIRAGGCCVRQVRRTGHRIRPPWNSVCAAPRTRTASIATVRTPCAARAAGFDNLETPAAEVPELEDDLDEDTVWEQGPVVVREKSHETVPMSVEQAVTEMEMVGHDFFLFIDEDR